MEVSQKSKETEFFEQFIVNELERCGIEGSYIDFVLRHKWTLINILELYAEKVGKSG